MKRQKEKSFERRQELLDAAIREFGEKGFEKASLNRILQEARISKGTFYYHFENKEDLYFYLISTVIERKKQFLSQALNPSAGQGDLFAIFRLYAQTGLDFARLNPDVQRFAESFAREKGSEIYEKALGRFHYSEDAFIRNLVEQAYRRGELRQDLPLAFVRNLIGFLFTRMAELTEAVRTEDYEKDIGHLIDVLRDGLARKGEER